MQIKEFVLSDIQSVKNFADEQIGEGYFSLEELTENQKKSVTATGEICSFVLVDPLKNVIHGLRLAYPPGQWSHGKGSKLRPDLWPFDLSNAGYFQSLFLSKQMQSKGWGPILSLKSMDIFRKIGAKGIVTHCWKESPNNSSVRYLEKLGFVKAIEHPLYWADIDYECTLDGRPCQCTSIEMYFNLSSNP